MARMSVAERQRDYYHLRIELGLCPKGCGRRRVPGRTECEPCRDARRARERGKYQRRKAREQA